MTHFIYLLWSLFAIEHNNYYDKVETYCPTYNIETSSIVCEANLSLIERMSPKEYMDYVFICLQQESKMFLL